MRARHPPSVRRRRRCRRWRIPQVGRGGAHQHKVAGPGARYNRRQPKENLFSCEQG
jgi:hypothetical protein